MTIEFEEERGQLWRLRRLSAGYRIVDVAVHCAISVNRYSDIERGCDFATEAERKLIEEFLPPLPDVITRALIQEPKTNQS